MNTITLLKELVKIESFSGHEQKLAQFIMQWAKENELPAEMQDDNIYIKFQVGSSKALIFNAHMDTVKPGNIDFWSSPPTGHGAGKIKGNKLYGLGASDDKSAIASFLTLAHQLKGLALPVDVFIVFVTNEEISGAGSQSFVNYFQKNYADKYKEVSAVIGEPTDLKSTEIGHRGNIFLKVTTHGDSGHGSKPWKIKQHAIGEHIKVIQKITTLGELLTKEYADATLGAPSFCLTGIQSDDSSVNKVPASCFSTWDIRTTPNLHDKVLYFVQKEVGKDVMVEFIEQPSPFGLTSPKSKVIGLLKKIVPDLKVKISPGSNDICFFTEAGVPAITFGPGKKNVIHKPNEFVEIDKVKEAVTIYKQLLESFSV